MKLKRDISKIIDCYTLFEKIKEIGKIYYTQYSELKLDSEEIKNIAKSVEKIKSKKMTLPCDIVWSTTKKEDRYPNAREAKRNLEMRIKEKNLLKNTKKKQMRKD
jgi:hypothetical protein